MGFSYCMKGLSALAFEECFPNAIWEMWKITDPLRWGQANWGCNGHERLPSFPLFSVLSVVTGYLVPVNTFQLSHMVGFNYIPFSLYSLFPPDVIITQLCLLISPCIYC